MARRTHQSMEEKFSDREDILSRIEVIKTGDEVQEVAPKISVIVPIYNVAEVISETLDSIFAQKFKDFEVVLLNDGSTDTEELEQVLEPYMPKLVYGYQKNLGCSAARNAAMILSRGEYFAYLDGDDMWLPDFLGSQLKHLEDNGLEMVYCDAELFGDNYHNAGTYMESAPSNGEANLNSLLNTECNVIASGTLLTRECLEKFGLFDHASVRAQDFELWTRLALNGVKIGYQKKVLLRYRVSADSLSGTNVERAERGVRVLEFVRDKYEFPERELETLNTQLDRCRVEVKIENAKLNLVERDFDMARDHMLEAAKISGSLKLRLIAALLRAAPKLVHNVFRKYRPLEYTFIENHGR